MAWATELQDASFRGVPFDCVSINDTQTKTTAIHQSPYSNHASIEDMGNDPRRISIQAICAGENYLASLTALEIALEENGAGELIHPIYGIKQVQVQQYTVNHDVENVDSCSISIDFTQAKVEKRELFVPVEIPVEIDPLSILKNPASALEQALEKLRINDNNKFLTAINSIKKGLQIVRRSIGIVESTIENLLSPIGWATDLIDDITKVVTFDTNIGALSKYRDVLNRVKRLKNLFDNDDSPKELQQMWVATQVAATVSITQSAITIARDQTLIQDKEISITPVELAIIQQQTRQILQQAIIEERKQIINHENVTAPRYLQIQVYKSIADQLYLQLQQLINIRPSVTTTRILVPCTLHWLAHNLYQDMSRATEIQRLNPDLQNPALLQLGMELTVYAR